MTSHWLRCPHAIRMNHTRPPDVLLEDLFSGVLAWALDQIEVPKVSTQTELEPVDLSKYTFAPECDRCGAEATIIGQGCGGLLASGPLAGGEQIVVGLLRLRFAAGVCVLAAGLLMGVPGARSPLPIPVPAVPLRTAMTAPTLQASSTSTGAKKPKGTRLARHGTRIQA